MLPRLSINISPRASAIHINQSLFWINNNVKHAREIDYQPARAGRGTAGCVAAAYGSKVEGWLLGAREKNTSRDVGGSEDIDDYVLLRSEYIVGIGRRGNLQLALRQRATTS